ncbi:MAG TPA: NUDIX domain-containing protein [Candidatus Limnocylindria bacterium]|nr:NUDIX domain-containing protein [Candidatus Limnocylindria bacterium]
MTRATAASVPVCPHCAAPEEQPIVCERCSWRWYANPKPAAAVLLERPGATGGEPAILLLRRAVEPGYGAWDLPAGYLDPGESPEAAAVRETREEAGLEVELLGLAGVYHSPLANAVTCVYHARQADPSARVRIDPESSDHAWVARSAVADWLPRMAFPSMAAAVRDWAARADGP